MKHLKELSSCISITYRITGRVQNSEVDKVFLVKVREDLVAPVHQLFFVVGLGVSLLLLLLFFLIVFVIVFLIILIVLSACVGSNLLTNISLKS